jgi:tetratricopeptide (TPR) repeat protein
MNLTRYIEVAVLMVLVTVFATVAYQQNFVWKDDFSLWSEAVKKSPRKAMPYNNLGEACERKGFIERAIMLAGECIALDPNLAEPYNNLGICYLDKGWIDKALVEFKHAIKVNPNYALAHKNLGSAYHMLG